VPEGKPEPYRTKEDQALYPADQLVPLVGGRYTTVFHGPPGTDIGDLACDLEPYMEGGEPAIINHSGWSLTEAQVKALEAGAHIRLSVWQQPIPPLAVSIEPPVCHCHGEPMHYEEDESGFYCRHQPTAGHAVPTDPLAAAKLEFKPGEPEPDDEAAS
jgi:hypothetical protein